MERILTLPIPNYRRYFALYLLCLLFSISTPPASGSECTNTGDSIQSALDDANVKGAGTVNLPAGVYCIDVPLILDSGVTLSGAGPGATIIRGPVQHYQPHPNPKGTDVIAAIAAVAANDVSIKNLTVDLLTNRTNSNGISLLPSGKNYKGLPAHAVLLKTYRYWEQAICTLT